MKNKNYLVDAPPAEPGDEGDDELQDNETFAITNVFANERKDKYTFSSVYFAFFR